MAAKMKGIYKGFKCISQIFAAVKEREMDIGYPTDVQHVAHIGLDGATGDSPSWMSEFKSGSDSLSPRQSFATARESNSFAFSIGSSRDLDQAMGQQPMADVFRNNIPPTDLPNIPKRQRRKKKSSSSSTNSSPKCSSTSSRSSRSAISKSTYRSATSLHT